MRPQLRGVQVSSRFGGEKGFADLREWGANVIRLPIGGGEGTNLESHAEHVAAWLDRMDSDLLPLAEKHGIRLIPCLDHVPGGREKTADFRMFNDARCLDVFRADWRKIASRLKGNPLIAGYDLCNEPHQSHFASVADYWTAQRLAAEDIRAIDSETPIIFEAYGWDGPEAFWAMSPVKLTNIIYEVHMYYPMAFTHQGLYSWKQGPEYPSASNEWDRAYLRRTLTQVRDFEAKHGAKIFVGEFSAATWAKGADRYIVDCISLFNEFGWDWTYHSFREYEGWSVEHEGGDRWHVRPATSETSRKKALLEGLTGRSEPPLKLLVVGNSIVRHQVAPKLGWTNDWGMAASAADKDFAHQIALGVERWTGRTVELRTHTTKMLEREFLEYDVHRDFDEEVAWKPDYIVFALGENIPVFTNETHSAIWRKDLIEAGALLKEANRDARFVFRTTFWCKPDKNREIKAAADAVGGAVADLGWRGNDLRYQARGLFEHSGVACHPGDLGMKMMAQIVLRAFGFAEPFEELPPCSR